LALDRTLFHAHLGRERTFEQDPKYPIRDADRASDENGVLRLLFLTPTWEDYLALAFDEVRQFGAGSIHVMRRMRAALDGLASWLPTEDHRQAALRYLGRLDHAIEKSGFDSEDQRMALDEDRQGIGLSR
jgi:uncharacterized membrane protein